MNAFTAYWMSLGMIAAAFGWIGFLLGMRHATNIVREEFGIDEFEREAEKADA